MSDDRTTAESFLGTWRIQGIGEHTREKIDLVGPAEVVFDKDGLGSIRFMSTQADLDCRFVDRAGEVFAEFTWALQGHRSSIRERLGLRPEDGWHDGSSLLSPSG